MKNQMTDRELAEHIVSINNRIRTVALRTGRKEGIGQQVTLKDVEAGILRAGLDLTTRIVENMFSCTGPDDPLMAEVMKDFCNWMNVHVYRPITEEAIETLVEQGLAEIRGMDEHGEFTYGLTPEGKKISGKMIL